MTKELQALLRVKEKPIPADDPPFIFQLHKEIYLRGDITVLILGTYTTVSEARAKGRAYVRDHKEHLLSRSYKEPIWMHFPGAVSRTVVFELKDESWRLIVKRRPFREGP